MTRQKKENLKKIYLYGMYQFLRYNLMAYNHDLDKEKLYGFMYKTYGISWHKTQRLFFKELSADFRDEIRY